MSRKPLASLSLDLDNQWSYMKIHGDSGWESFPSYLPVVVPRVLAMLARRGLTITFFIVGQDAALEENSAALASIAAAGHEIGNHSFSHEPWFHLYTRGQCEDEIARAEEHIERVTGQHPIGFRGPGFSSSQTLLDVLAERNYLYDASSFPTYLGPLARLYYFLHMNSLDRSQREQRNRLFGSFSDGFATLRPHRLRAAHRELVEIPVTTMPLVKVPFHASYILYLATYSPALAITYFRTALAACRIAGTQPSLLLHPLDFLGADDVSCLSFFPAMQMPAASKLAIMARILDLYAAEFHVLNMQQHATATLAATAAHDLDAAPDAAPALSSKAEK